MQRVLVRSGVIIGGFFVSLLLLAVAVEILRMFPPPEMAQLVARFWQSVPPAQSPLEQILLQAEYYLYLIGHIWLLGLVPIIGALATWLVMKQLADDELALYLERIHAQEILIGQLTRREADAIGKWDLMNVGMDRLFERAGECWMVVDRAYRLRRWNAATVNFLRGFGLQNDELEGRSLTDLWPGYLNIPLFKAVPDAAEGQSFNGQLVLQDGRQHMLAWVWPLGQDVAVLLRDVSHAQEESSGENYERMTHALVEESWRPLALLDKEGRYVQTSRRWAGTLGLPAGMPVIGRGHVEVMPDFPANFKSALVQAVGGQTVGREDERRVVNGQEEIYSWQLQAWRDVAGQAGGFVFNVTPVTELVRLRAQVQQAGERENALAYTDLLTGLPNRQLFMDRLNMALAQAYRQLGKVALFFLDLDGFKAINDKLGHEAGDLLLKQVAERLKSCVRNTDTVARLGGDEFTMILNIRDRADAEQVAQKILQVIHAPFNLQGQEGHVGTSIGIAMYPQDGTQAADLIRMADNAMYAAKQAGKNTWRFHVAQQPEKA